MRKRGLQKKHVVAQAKMRRSQAYVRRSQPHPPWLPADPRARDFGLSIAAGAAFAGRTGAKTRETTPRRALRLADALRSKNNKQQKARTARSQAKHARLLALFIFAGARARQKPGKSSLLRALVNS